MRKPPITITCDCGATGEVAYGECWDCGTCHRSWNTLQIPAEEYEGLLRRVRRHQIEIVAMAAVAAAAVIPLVVAFGSRYALLTPFLLAAWLFIVLPAWRRRYRRTAREAPKWELQPK